MFQKKCKQEILLRESTDEKLLTVGIADPYNTPLPITMQVYFFILNTGLWPLDPIQ